MFVGCSRSHQGGPVAADSTSTILGELHGEFVHGFNPFYGAVVYLVPANPTTDDWWERLGRPHHALIGPQQDASLPFASRTISDPAGKFEFNRVRRGAYYLYAQVLWTNTIGESTYFDGDAWIGRAATGARETTNVILQRSRSLFSRESLMQSPTSELPRLGEYVYVDQLPVAVKRVDPEYPEAAQRRGVDGTVLVQALVDKDGTVKETRVTKSIPMLDEAAATAVRQWVFKPGLARHKPVAVWVAVPIKFTL